MNAVEFVKKHGWSEAKAHLDYLISYGSEFGSVSKGGVEELKCLVESWELVKHVGGLEKCKHEYECLLKFRGIDHFLLKQAIADMESVGEIE